MSESSRARFAETVRIQPVDLALACLLIGSEVDADLDPQASLHQLDELAAAVDRNRPPVQGLRAALAGFTGDAHDYQDIRSSLLHEVLARRAGLPILLSVVWLEVARRSGVRADGIGLPGHFIARIDDDYVDPFSGGADVDVTGVPQELLRPWHANEILLRILTNIRVWARQAPDRASLRLWAVELSLLLPHHPAGLRRERGLLLMSAGQFLDAAKDLEAYAESVAPADPAAAAQAAGEARAARARLN